MEVNNLLLTKNGEALEKLLKCYSTNQEMCEETIRNLLVSSTTEDGKKKDIFNSDLQVREDKTSISREILEKHLNLLELGLIDNE